MLDVRCSMFISFFLDQTGRSAGRGGAHMKLVPFICGIRQVAQAPDHSQDKKHTGIIKATPVNIAFLGGYLVPRITRMIIPDQKRLFQENINSLRIYSIRSTKRNQNPLKDWTVFTLWNVSRNLEFDMVSRIRFLMSSCSRSTILNVSAISWFCSYSLIKLWPYFSLVLRRDRP